MVDNNSGSLFGDDELRVSDSQEPHTVQESLFDMGPDKQIGYRVLIAYQAVGISYRQLDYWIHTKLVESSVHIVKGSGTQCLYSFRDILVSKIVRSLSDTGTPLQSIHPVVDRLRNLGVNDLATITLVSDGRTTCQYRSNEGVIDLLNDSQGVFGIAVPDTMKELTDTITLLPSERIDDTQEDSGTGIDELAERRRRRIS